MPTGPAFGAALALLSALVWGSGDFAGGLAARRADPMQVLAWSAFSGIVLLIAFAVVTREPLPSANAIAWAAAAGLSGAMGIAGLYRGLAAGRAATVAPTAAVVTATLPVVFSAISIGLPRASQMAGFVLAVVGIWLVARTGDGDANAPAHLAGESLTARVEAGTEVRPSRGLGLAMVAGAGFGGFLILIARVPPALVFLPLTVARTAALVAALSVMALRRLPLPSPVAHPIALVAGALDAGGNVFYVLARRYARLDVAAVLSSLYPVATVVLAWIILQERIDRAQWLGAAVCCLAVALIAS